MSRVPDQRLIAVDAASGSGDHLRATRDEGGSYAMIYIPSGQHVRINLTEITGTKIRGWWFNPRDGVAKLIGEFDKSGVMEFRPPYDRGGRDWVLVIDDAAGNFPPPGTRP